MRRGGCCGRAVFARQPADVRVHAVGLGWDFKSIFNYERHFEQDGITIAILAKSVVEHIMQIPALGHFVPTGPCVPQNAFASAV